MPSGILIVDKPSGWTSHDVVARLRRALGERRIGHAGTLDPMATGVLPVFVGRATRAVEFAAERDKEYHAVLRLGTVTDTQDSSGSILSEQPVSVSRAQLAAALEPFRGDISQIPPMYSAIKRDGKKLYELARAGKSVPRAARAITIHELTLLEQQSERDFLLRVRCSKGTYIRTLCHDIGAALGCGGCMSALRRTMAAGFLIETAHPLSDILTHEAPERLLLPVADYFAQHHDIFVPAAIEKRIRNGVSFPTEAPDGSYRVFNEEGAFLMLGAAREGIMSCIKSFFEV